MSESATDNLESALYVGKVRHRRFRDASHEFEFPLFMVLLKLDEISTLTRRLWQFGPRLFHWARFRRQDYIRSSLNQHADLQAAVVSKMSELSGQPDSALSGDVFLLCQLRYMGFYFSPLNLYYLRQNGTFTHLLAEVSNTPWNERHYYLLDIKAPQPHSKQFHVSPFNPMAQNYHWKIQPPGQAHGVCAIHLACKSQNDDQVTEFDATLTLRERPLNQKEFTRVLLGTPIQTVSILFGIYFQALKLFLKKAPVYRHPRRNKEAMETRQTPSR